MVQLYESEILDTPKPVGEPINETAPQPKLKPEKPKKERTPAQLAAFEKAKETRRLKKEALEQEKKAQEEQAEAEKKAQAEKVQAQQEKKEAQKEKRRLARLAKRNAQELATPTISEASQDLVQQQPKKKQRKAPAKKVTEPVVEDPPKWFQEYVKNVRIEENNVSEKKKPQKQVRIEATETAKEKWSNDFTRNKVNNELSNHADRMFRMIFGNRRR